MENITKEQIQEVINLHEKMSRSYFWKPPKVATLRRIYEKNNSLDIEGIYKNKKIKLQCITKCSCNHVYYRSNFIINDNKVTIASVKKLLNE